MSKVLRIILWPVSHFASWLWGLFLAILRRAMSNGVTGTASQFAYNTFLATVPFMFVVVTAINQSPRAFKALFEALDGTIPGITGLTDTFRNSTAKGTAAGFLIVVGVIAGLYVASNAIGALVDGLDRAQHLNHRPWWRGKLINFGFAAGASVLAAASTLVLAGGPDLVRGLARLLGAGEALRDLLADSLALPVGLVTLLLFTILIYRFGPNGMRLGFRTILPGALLSVLATFGLTRLIALYADAFNNLDAVYGTLGSLFVYLTFLYFTGLMFLVGAELNAELVHRRLVRASTRDAAARAAIAKAGGQGGSPAPPTRVGADAADITAVTTPAGAPVTEIDPI